ncbi:hypothetical protein GCM10009745_80250 [Kribbella yunnanensis]|uniref:Uncharacterized protein n=1 Tax=Kribbella yunnanensis TaxID=190194 RepID=A0ABP4V9J6_9ACTN
MSEAQDRREPGAAPADEQTPAPDRDAWDPSGLPGQALTTLLFHCGQHAEEQVVDYYDPESPPRCTHGDLMTRKAR